MGNTAGIEFVERIEQQLIKKNLKRTAFAKSVGVTNQAFTDWKRRGTIPAADIALRIADALSVDLRWLITGQEQNVFSQVSPISTLSPVAIEFAKDFDRLPVEYQTPLLNLANDFKALCFKLEKENTLDIG